MSSHHRPVPQIGRGPGQFSRAAQPIQSPLAGPFILEPKPESDLAMEIFARVAAQYIAAGRTAAEWSEIAKNARVAAQAYFAGDSDDAQEVPS